MAISFKEEFEKLNSEQKEAVEIIDGPLLLFAGPGTGKTQLLSMRVANILLKTDMDPSNILCLTFTDAAAQNMRERLIRLIGTAANRIGIYTFHGFGTYIIERYPEFFYDAPLLSAVDELTEFDLIVKILEGLTHNNPLRKKVGDDFLHLHTIRQIISWLKQAGYSPDELKVELEKNKIFLNRSDKILEGIFTSSPAYKQKDLYLSLYKKLSDHADGSDIAKNSAFELAEAIDELSDKSRFAKPITAWRNKWLVQESKGTWVFSDKRRAKFMEALCDVYQQYQIALASQGLYSFDDMILRSIQAIKNNDELRLSLQEQYQYILVDEYQDTNGSQNALLNLLASNPVNEEMPNLMVVGDENQAIYRFQGADSSIMSEFIGNWPEAKVINLKRNYRSGQSLLNLAQHILSNSENQKNDDLSYDPQVSGVKYDTKILGIQSQDETLAYIETADKIKDLIKSGVEPSSIAVLAPKHRFLESFAPHLTSLGITINYERREQILNQPRIIEILDLIELTDAVNKTRFMVIDALLPKILSAEYWEVSPDEWWKIAVDSHANKTRWLDTIEENFGSRLKNFSIALKKIAMESNNQPFELTLAQLMGNAPVEIDKQIWYMPWRQYYFSDEKISNETAEFLKFIGQYNTLISKFKEWQGTKVSSLSDFQNFINLYRRSGIALLDPNPINTELDAVNIMTAYKAKGLEWDYVFLLNCQDDVWGPQTRNRNFSFSVPTDLTWIKPLSDSADDLIKLFYVALTRAKQNIYLVSFNSNEKGRKSFVLRWLLDIQDKITLMPQVADHTATAKNLKTIWENPLTEPSKNLKEILSPALAKYKLSATHLNDFLDVTKGGPRNFLLKHLLKVPELVNANMMYGDAVHKTIEFIHGFLKTNHVLPSTEIVIEVFEQKLVAQAFSPQELALYLARGKDDLVSWYKANKSSFTDIDISEYGFPGESIMIGQVKLTGKIDLIRPVGDNKLKVTDYKTGQPLESWKGGTGYAPIESHNYQRQLYFYKLLTENSTSLSKNKVVSGELCFITPNQQGRFVSLALDMEDEQSKSLVSLIEVVWQHIISLNLPDTESYPKNASGIKAFENDLLNKSI
jgi:DNA helicase-2/ATP-dependent DNA helicase PcrA